MAENPDLSKAPQTGAGVNAEHEAIAARVAAGGKYEPWHDLPDAYRAEAARMMEFHMMSELVGPVHEYRWVPRAPSFEAKLILSAKTQDEVGHGLALIRVCEDLTGKTRSEYMEEILEGPPRFMNIFHYPWDDWADPVVAAWLADGAEITRQTTLLKSSYGPYARAMKKIVKEEGFHHQAGRYLMHRMVGAGPSQKRMAQEAVNRWWPRILSMFGPRASASKHGEVLLSFQLKIAENEELRQNFLSTFVPKIKRMGLEIPDDAVVLDEETGLWGYTEPDWDEFKGLLRGGSPYGEELQRSLRNARRGSQWFMDEVWAA
ncbi:1,2-phenylacetyl-CoA epoxidase subunit A [Nocardioides marmoriginsengisoli]|uniref:1,2-phenylacetyl-CoA epoxidase subunit A n=1 Tax=Nocardioides marmoriginsengisoli TaxID=661483 RepID=A0A3N0CHE6_9ACTN|nr:1,2-phenylacetyl-CoA epoxidase subunit PaaA [Nocardioides marmoriginsengisoli]RNL62877.1 1,2-phenylacetyl-CoA epoxidase subunit A [Nocardioides marmoriginsengisoli]